MDQQKELSPQEVHWEYAAFKHISVEFCFGDFENLFDALSKILVTLSSDSEKNFNFFDNIFFEFMRPDFCTKDGSENLIVFIKDFGRTKNKQIPSMDS